MSTTVVPVNYVASPRLSACFRFTEVAMNLNLSIKTTKEPLEGKTTALFASVCYSEKELMIIPPRVLRVGLPPVRQPPRDPETAQADFVGGSPADNPLVKLISIYAY